MGTISQKYSKVLVVDDDPASLNIVRKALEYEGYEVEVADNGNEALEQMKNWKPHLVLLDISMPGIDGLVTLKYLRQQSKYVSVIFVSGKSKTDDVVTGLNAGADDYICKPFNTLELLARVRGQLRIKELQDNLSVANEKLKQLVDIDDLTGLFNMRSLYNKLDFELNRARRYGRSVCVIMMDMDHFKSINDDHDHLFGSYVLAETGRIIRDNMRKIDFAARYGGDEFLIVLTEMDLQGASTFAERLRETVSGYEFKSDSFEAHLTCSIGFAISPTDDESVDARSLVRHADRALYVAKANGRNCIAYDIFDSNQNENAQVLNLKASVGS